MGVRLLLALVVAGATGYLGKYAVQAFKRRGYWVRALTRSRTLCLVLPSCVWC